MNTAIQGVAGTMIALSVSPVWQSPRSRLVRQRSEAMRGTALIVTLTLLCFGTAGWLVAQGVPVPLPRDVADDAYALYSYIYQHSNRLDANEVIAVVQDVAPFRNDASSKTCVKPETGEERTMVDSAIRLSQDQHAWEARFDFGRPYKLLSKAQAAEAIDCIGGFPKDQSTCQPYKAMRYVRYLSAPGFNYDHTRAVVCISRVCGGLCGEGNCSVYRKTRQAWEREEKGFASCIWVALAWPVLSKWASD
jgi:hypothetical protein